MRKRLIRALCGLLMLSGSAAWAHGVAEPKHGGVVQEASDRSFELVATANGAAIYIDDHGEQVKPVGWSGRLTVINGSKRVEVPLTVAGDKFEAKGVKLRKGTKVVAVLTDVKQKLVTVRFTLH